MVRLCSLSRELYNRTNYIMRQSWFSQKGVEGFRSMPGINVLIDETKDLDCFRDESPFKPTASAVGPREILI
ncbi:MAG: hypothetical protein WC072_06920 [Methanoregulaceae archaeon]